MSIYDSSVKLALKLINNFKNQKSKLEYQEFQSVPDEIGGMSGMWVKVFDADVAIIPIYGTERLKALQMNSQVSHEAYIVYSAGIPKASGRAIFNGKEYNITAVVNIAEANAVWKITLNDGVIEGATA